jgi:NADH-quinone oxidoreductase subunit M
LDLNARETATLVPLIVLVFVIGIFPNPLLTRMHASVAHLLAAPKTPVFAIEPRPEPSTEPRSAAAIAASPTTPSFERATAR